MSQKKSVVFERTLQSTWTLRYLENEPLKSWEEIQNEIIDFDTLQDFWSHYNTIKPPSEINIGSHYSLFKKDIRPTLTDPANKNGGRWVMKISRSSEIDLDNVWVDVILCLIDEKFDHSNMICGAVLDIRTKSYKISIWTSHGKNYAAISEIGNKLREALNMSPQNLQYQLHEDIHPA